MSQVPFTARQLFVLIVLLGAAAALLMIADSASAQGPKPTPPKPKAPTANAGTAFTYQGQLKKNGAPLTSTCNFTFTLSADSGGAIPIGSPAVTTSVSVINGLVTARVNGGGEFGTSAFNGDARWLQTTVQCTGDGSATALSRQQLTPAPMAFALPGLYTTQNGTSPNIIGGYSGNVISNTVVGGTIGGGGASGLENRVWGSYATVGGGAGNTANGSDATIGGGYNNTAKDNATVGGGSGNTASGNSATVGGGGANTASGFVDTVGGGYSNTASGSSATVGGGWQNAASGGGATVGGGSSNTASGDYASVAGGESNTASGLYSFAAGHRAKANNQGAFVWADSTNADIASTAGNQFIVRASGGITMYTDSSATNGATLQPGSGTWSSVSDRAMKANFVSVNGQGILARLNAIPIQTWNYTTQDASIRHIGPTAQDFYAAFNVGEDNRHITTIDADGVAFAAIQGLYQENQKLKAKGEKQQAELEELKGRVAALENASGLHARANADSIPTNSVLVGGMVALGFVVARRRS